MENQFSDLQDQYFKLRGQFATGRITESEFDAALRDLAFQDAQGRSWMLGANTGDWYYADGENWIKGDPSQEPTPSRERTIESVEPPVSTAPDDLETQPEPKRLALAFFFIGVFLLLVVGAFFYLLQGGNLLASNDGANLPTRIVPQTQVADNSNSLPPPTATPTVRAAFSVTPTPVLVTATPDLVLDPTNVLPGLTTIPTITPGAPGTVFPDASNSDSDAPPESSSPYINTSGLASGVYVTNLQIAPNPPHHREAVNFTATFLNTSPQTVGMEWRVVLLDPSKQGHNKDYGQSDTSGIQVPPGTSEFWISYTAVTSGGPCITLQVLPARRMDDNSRVFMKSPNGGNYSANVTFC